MRGGTRTAPDRAGAAARPRRMPVSNALAILLNSHRCAPPRRLQGLLRGGESRQLCARNGSGWWIRRRRDRSPDVRRPQPGAVTVVRLLTDCFLGHSW